VRDVRIVGATHVPLRERVRDGAFRRDLYHRLEVFVVRVPPLRERPVDIPALAERFLEASEHELGTHRLSAAAMSILTTHEWPGNVRELRNAVYRAAHAARERPLIDGADVRSALRVLEPPDPEPLPLSPEAAWQLVTEGGGNVSRAARLAGLPRTTFRKLLRGSAPRS
jgi:DNA-binding NtrC family response regulator